MNRQARAGKKSRLEIVPSRRPRDGACAHCEIFHAQIISNFTGKRKPQFSPGRRCLLMGWSMIFTTIGVACAAKWFMDLLDKLEGREAD